MGKILFRDFKIFDGTDFIESNEVLVENGKISKIGNSLDSSDAEIIDGFGKILSPGFIDLHAHFRDPGGEWNEDLTSGARAGAAGGRLDDLQCGDRRPEHAHRVHL